MSLADVTDATTCQVSLMPRWPEDKVVRKCGLPAVLGALCEKHNADRVRLS